MVSYNPHTRWTVCHPSLICSSTGSEYPPKTNHFAPENMPTPKRKGKSSSNHLYHLFSGANLFVSGMGKTRIGNWKLPFSEFSYQWKPVARIPSHSNWGPPTAAARTCVMFLPIPYVTWEGIIPWLGRNFPLQRKTWGKNSLSKMGKMGPTKWQMDQPRDIASGPCLKHWKNHGVREGYP